MVERKDPSPIESPQKLWYQWLHEENWGGIIEGGNQSLDVVRQCVASGQDLAIEAGHKSLWGKIVTGDSEISPFEPGSSMTDQ